LSTNTARSSGDNVSRTSNSAGFLDAAEHPVRDRVQQPAVPHEKRLMLVA
jgi:hypothetical protein